VNNRENGRFVEAVLDCSAKKTYIMYIIHRMIYISHSHLMS
jgi:hypothetical protein